MLRKWRLDAGSAEPRLVALAVGCGGLKVEFDVTGLAPRRGCFATGEDVQVKPGAFFGFGGRSSQGRLRRCAFGIVSEEEDGQHSLSY